MQKRKVLLLLSNSIDCSVINASPRFNGYEFHQVAMEDCLGKDGEEILEKVADAMEAHKPAFLLVHLGFTFLRQPLEFLEIVQKIHWQFPEARLIFDKGMIHIYKQIKPITQKDPLKHDILDWLGNIPGEKEDPEIAVLKKVL